MVQWQSGGMDRPSCANVLMVKSTGGSPQKYSYGIQDFIDTEERFGYAADFLASDALGLVRSCALHQA